MVHPDYRDGGRGDRLLEQMEKMAAAQNIHQLFILTTRTAHWFRERGFEAAEIQTLPMQRQALYNYQRNAKVFIKPLTGC